ncbi:MAG TPA: ribosome maturation factor RimP [Burkholderiales bacterium]|nr:ribosome maturation factor RimP [Burkholderiales bacterium]HTT36841.1 ribosome maturation factor RimP [Burkholderiales bacterium]
MSHKDLSALLETTVSGLGFELVDLEVPGRGALIRVFIDRPGGVKVEDCAAVSNHLTRLFAVEQIDYGRLEVSSPGLDRRLREASDFRRFQGQRAQIRLRVPLQGRRNFVGTLRGVSDAQLQLEVDGALVSLELAQVEKARLVPTL